MLKKLLPILLLILGTGAGIGAGIMLSPPATSDEPHAEEEAPKENVEEVETSDSEFTKFGKQFVVPLMKNDKVVSIIVVTLSLEIAPGANDRVSAREPKLRDLFLRVMFDHASMGGFRGAFTQPDNLDILRNALRETARKEMGPDIRDVLITDIGRQDN
ncbi:MAG: flagellar basal body-associated protein FliL [Pseudooceanicola sp.]|jgi:flagellar basal body-associated protein FliL|nr:flagellar basal body-associated protein FliL [Pseudooceanicola sp.]|tara:strand:+ start:1210 stop:1686 length:477 start_codon:yes stop_codon:yes gene_type:complete